MIKKTLVFMLAVVLSACTCLGQFPSKIVVGDTLACQAFIPDVMPYVNASANCSDVIQLYQVPEAGTPITEETILTVYAITEAGIETTKDIRIVPVFLDSARITITADFFAYEDTDVFQMFKVASMWMYNYPTRFIDAIKDTTNLGTWNKIQFGTLPNPLYYTYVPIKYDERAYINGPFKWTVYHR